MEIINNLIYLIIAFLLSYGLEASYPKINYIMVGIFTIVIYSLIKLAIDTYYIYR